MGGRKGKAVEIMPAYHGIPFYVVQVCAGDCNHMDGNSSILASSPSLHFGQSNLSRLQQSSARVTSITSLAHL